MPALAVFAVLQALHLGREHIHSLNRSGELNVELAARVVLLETGQQEIQHLNTELRRHPTATVPLRPERTGSSPGGTSPKDSPASLTQTGLLAGTPEYLAPELADGAQILSPAADVFSLGILAHEVLFCERPYAEPPVLVALRDGSIPPPPTFGASTGALGPEAADVLARCLSRSPDGRPSAEEVADALSQARRSVPRRNRAD